MQSYRSRARHMQTSLSVLALIAFVGTAFGLGDIVEPFESKTGLGPASAVDELVLTALEKQGIKPARRCSDEVFLRRVAIDVTGTIPTAHQVRRFLADQRPRKRALVIDSLLTHGLFADYWSLKWCDLLRVKAEFPINLWPNAVQAYHRWIRDSIAANKPYDQFARELLTSSGSNFRVPAVNFCRAIQGKEPAAIATAVALTFMGTRLGTWSSDDRVDMETLFSRVAFKGTAEWKEEIVHLDPTPTKSLMATLPGGEQVRIKPGKDPRVVFADWLISPDNPWFARNICNRVWSWLMGRGIIHEPDDIRADNPPSNPELLAFLEQELAENNYDLLHLYRLILNSRTYQQSSIPRSDHPEATALFAHYPVRRLDAEVLIDALCQLFGSSENYSSQIPEPFTFIPQKQRTITLADGSITSQFLEMFGRPARDTGLESERNNAPTDAQRLHLLNSTHIQSKIEKSWAVKGLVKQSKGKPDLLARAIYLHVLSRHPTAEELAVVRDHAKDGFVNRRFVATDLCWALINSKEFLYRH